jgi:hypothetical protein
MRLSPLSHPSSGGKHPPSTIEREHVGIRSGIACDGRFAAFQTFTEQMTWCHWYTGAVGFMAVMSCYDRVKTPYPNR